MSKLEWPRGRYYFGPIIITVDLIEPFIMYNVQIGIDPSDMHKVKFESMEEISNFIHMLDYYQDYPINSKTSADKMLLEIADKRQRDDKSREIEYQIGKHSVPW